MSDEEIKVKAFELALAAHAECLSDPDAILDTAKKIYAWIVGNG